MAVTVRNQNLAAYLANQKRRDLRRSFNANADLASLSISAGTLTPPFSPDLLAYSVEVETEVDALTITASPLREASDVQVLLDGVPVTGAVPLAEGANNISIVVTAPDGSHTKAYQIIANREEAPVEVQPYSFVLTPAEPDGVPILGYFGAGTEAVGITATPVGSISREPFDAPEWFALFADLGVGLTIYVTEDAVPVIAAKNLIVDDVEIPITRPNPASEDPSNNGFLLAFEYEGVNFYSAETGTPLAMTAGTPINIDWVDAE